MEKERRDRYLYYEEDEIDLYELWLTLKRRKKTIFGVTGLFTIIAVILCFILPTTYKTETTLIPIGGKSTGGLSSLLSSLPISVPIPTGSESGITVEAVLKSRILRERVIKDLNLLPKLFPDKWDSEKNQWILKDENDRPPTVLDGAKVLDKLISVSTDKKTGVITLSVEFKKDPQLAYDIANAVLKEANKILNEKSFTLARKYRIYIEKQLNIAKEKLQKVEEIYKKFMEGKIKEVPLIFGNADFDKLKEGLQSLQDEKVSKERIEKLKQEVESLKKKLKSLEQVHRRNNYYVSLPEYQLNLQKLQSQMSIAQKLFETLVKEYEMAKAQEMKEQISFQVIDPPYIPDPKKPYKPKKKLIVVVSLVSGLFLGIFVAFFKEWLDNVKKRREEEKSNA
ncbi:MAG: Wzz/FepE/Etk N-terminal domain-containing protein [Desulfurobacteriaceae bacterium]